MNKNLKKIVTLTLSLNMVLSFNFMRLQLNTVKAAGKGVVTTVDKKYAQSQVDFKFPEDNPSEALYARDKRAFKGYEGRGTILVENHGARTAELYINGKQVNIKNILKAKNGQAKIDIGRYTVDGDNALKVLNVSPKGSYINVKVFYPELVYGKPEEVGFSSQKLAKVDEYINSEVEQGFPGAVLMVVKDGKIIKNTAYGSKNLYDGYNLLENPEKMTTDTMFDLASNTKMFATNLALQKLVYEGKLNIDDLVTKYLPGFKDGENDKFKYKSTIRVRDLLNHRAGFAPSYKFYDPTTAGALYSQDRATTLKMLEKVPLIREPRTVVEYSDTDYMLLGYIIEVITGKTEDAYVEENIYKPLGLTHTLFNPLTKGYEKDDFAATERNGNTRDNSVSFPNIRQYTLQGEVHDEKAWYSMGGVAGHAGLFSNTHDMAVLAQLILNGGGYGGFSIFDKDTLDKFTVPTDHEITYGLGWDRQGDLEKTWEFGPYASNLTIGHTGWTGTVTNIDPKNDMAVILLTNVRNTPCPNGSFEAYDKLQTGRYGSIMSLVYEALMENNSTTKTAADKPITDVVSQEASQINAKFPEDNPTSRILARYRRVFQAYKGRGEMVVENHGATSAEVYINGHLVDVSSALKTSDGKANFSIGKYTVDGENAVKVLNVQPEGAYINVKIAYSELIYGSSKDNALSQKESSALDRMISSQVKNGLSGAALIVVKDGKILKSTNYGYRNKLDMSTFYINLVIQKLYSEKKLSIDDKVSKYISDFAAGGKENITIRQLLTHSAGISNDYAVLGSIIEKVTGQKKEEYIQNNIYKPLGLKSNMQDAAVLAQVMLNGGGYGGVKLFSKETVDQFIKPSNVKPTVAMGWDRQADAELTKEFGSYASSSTYGLVGSDGSTILMDPENDMAVILLTGSKSYSKGFNGSIMSLVYETFMEKGKLNEISYTEPDKKKAA